MSGEMREDGHLPATKADLRDFATKADLSAFATKADLLNFATKADLLNFPTKADMKAEFATFRTELREELRDMFRPIVATLANHTAELADIRSHIKEKMVTRDEFYSCMDGYARRVENSDYFSAKNLSRLDDHQKRISALEEKRS